MKNRKRYYGVIVLFLLVVIGIGYAALATTLNITGQSKIDKATWNVHFENVSVTSGSVKATKDATIDSNTTNLSYEIQLAQPGDFYEFTVDIKNAGSIDAMISEVLKSGLTQEQANYIAYTVSYSDGTDLSVKDRLSSGDIETVIVRVEFRKDITAEQLPNADQDLNLSLNVTYVQADDTASLFRADSWGQIVANVKDGKADNYYVGNTKTVDLGDLGTHVLRVANKSTPAECAIDGFSQTACGFVLEFVDVVVLHNMNATETNVGGWPASGMRTYLDSTVYQALPVELQNGIIDTVVVSGHGSSDVNNFTSTDRLYLLSTKEVWGKEGTSNLVLYDSAEQETRQLDYYKSIGLTTTNYRGAIKQRNGSAKWWWLRSAYSASNNSFYPVYTGGGWSNHAANFSGGVSPAFRLG